MFPKIVECLIAAGMTETSIVEAIGCSSQPSINRIRNGKQNPGYEVGRALELLADQRCPNWRRSAGVQLKASA